MSSVTQTIPNFYGGISEQPDYTKSPGQVKDVLNGIPDITYGLYKRPGSQCIGGEPLSGVVKNSNDAWNAITQNNSGGFFHYYRDETEGSYIGQVTPTGDVKVWRCSDGQLMTTAWSTAYSGTETNLKAYLANSDSQDIKALTINDTTFLTNSNSSKTISMTGTTDARPHTYGAFVDLVKTENGRQYGLNISTDDTTQSLSTATRIEISSDNLESAAEPAYGHCPGVGTKVFNVNGSSGQKNLVFRLTIRGQQVTAMQGNEINGEEDYSCQYTRELTLLHGGEGWETNDTVDVTLPSIRPDNPTVGHDKPNRATYTYTIKILDHETTEQQANIKAVRPAPTPFDADTAVSSAAILGGIAKELDYSPTTKNFIKSTNVDISAETITFAAAHGYDTGAKVTYSADVYSFTFGGTSTAIGGLEELGEYYVIKVSDTVIKLATTLSNANAGTAINLTSQGYDNTSGFDADPWGHTLYGKIEHTVIGNGIYIYSDTTAFNCQVLEKDLMFVMTNEANDIASLPTQCKHGYIVKINNTKADEDDYYLKFEGDNGRDGSGSWVECAKPGIDKSFDFTNMPVVIQRTASTTFTVKRFGWSDRTIGDDITNAKPSFVGKSINQVLFWRNRLIFLSGENVITSRAGSFGSFWNKSATSVNNSDPVDIACSSSSPAALVDGVEMNNGLLVFSTDQQFLLSTSDSIFNSDTAKLSSVSNYNYNKEVSPLMLGKSVGFLDNTGQYSRFFEGANFIASTQPDIAEQSKIVPRLLSNGINLAASSQENSIILFGKFGSDTVFGYKYYISGENRLQSSWFKWKLVSPIKYHFIVDDTYYFLDTNNFLQKINLVQASTDPSLVQDGVDYLLHLDNYISLSGGAFNASTNKTTFDSTTVDNLVWNSIDPAPSQSLVLIDDDETLTRSGRYTKPTVTRTAADNNTIIAEGNWSGITIKAGYLFDYQVDIPRFYVTRPSGDGTVADVNSSLVIHRAKISFGRIGSYEATLTRDNKANYTELYESTPSDDYDASDVAYRDEHIQTVPIYEKNTNFDLTVKSTHPSPATLRSIAWEGDYTNKFYRRA